MVEFAGFPSLEVMVIVAVAELAKETLPRFTWATPYVAKFPVQLYVIGLGIPVTEMVAAVNGCVPLF